MRRKLSHMLLAASSWLKACSKKLLPKGVVCDCLTLPGWFILDEMIIHQTPIAGKLIGFQWDYWPMPEPWIIEMRKLKRKL